MFYILLISKLQFGYSNAKMTDLKTMAAKMAVGSIDSKYIVRPH